MIDGKVKLKTIKQKLCHKTLARPELRMIKLYGWITLFYHFHIRPITCELL